MGVVTFSKIAGGPIVYSNPLSLLLFSYCTIKMVKRGTRFSNVYGHSAKTRHQDEVVAEAAPTETWWITLRLHPPYGLDRAFSQLHTDMGTPWFVQV